MSKIALATVLAVSTNLAAATDAQETAQTKIIDLDIPVPEQVDLSGKPKMVQCAHEAVSKLPIPGSHLYVEERNYNIFSTRAGEESEQEHATVIAKNRTAIMQGPFKSSSVGIGDHQFEDARTHEIKGVIRVINDGENVTINARHSGSYNPTIDEAKTQIDYTFDEAGNPVKRDGSAYSQDGNKSLSKPHGAWTIATAQTMEYKFSECMGFDLSELGRPDNAATSVNEPPYTSGIPLSTIVPN